MHSDADNRPPHPALRELRREFSDRRVLAAMAGVALILGIAGPFGTGAVMGLAPRIVYWAVLVVAAYAAGVAVMAGFGPVVPARLPRRLRLVVLGVVTGVAVTVVVTGINFAAFGPWLDSPAELLELAAAVVPITVVVAFLLDLLHPVAAPVPPPLLGRLPVEKRGALVALSVEDHYVRIRTDKGAEMVLMRLSDAVRETGGTPGGQVHRSHWVAWDAVQAVRREGDRAILTLSHGPEIPVSRARLKLLREAGVLPK